MKTIHLTKKQERTLKNTLTHLALLDHHLIPASTVTPMPSRDERNDLLQALDSQPTHNRTKPEIIFLLIVLLGSLAWVVFLTVTLIQIFTRP